MKRPLRASSKSSKNSKNSLVKRIQDFSHRHHLWSPGDGIVVGVSGGPDSMCLLHILFSLSSKIPFRLHVVHINYRLRKSESDQEEQLVRTYCAKNSIPLSTFSPKVPRNPSENALRDIRYKKFEGVRKRLAFKSIAVGHNKNDQAETLLLHLFRGCGPQGLVGMRPKRDFLIRPLLGVTRQEILKNLEDYAIPYHLASDNNSLKYTRNIIRHKILPVVTEIQPNIIETLSRNAELFSDVSEILSSVDASLLSFAVFTKKDVRFSARALLNLSTPLQKRALWHMLNALKTSPKSIEKKHIEELLRATRSQKNKYQSIALLGLIYKKKNDTVTLRISNELPIKKGEMGI